MTAPFLARLANAGVAPEQIDYVLCTHLHIDQCGWNTRLVDGHWIPTFPNARYIIVAIGLRSRGACPGAWPGVGSSHNSPSSS
ncbi:MBL fold metallo-hydrolase [Mesorhizobium sp. M0140]|uniref:MBL fold metallo-hydrolase n=1 Tax=Mesorhizobium sp. M0140 TaxID=2956893 RepID=UPI00333DCF20